LINKTLLGLSNTNELYSIVQRIREKIGRNYIKTIKGIGYKFEI
jgi:DNA-binding response OmpR family regulator